VNQGSPRSWREGLFGEARTDIGLAGRLRGGVTGGRVASVEGKEVTMSQGLTKQGRHAIVITSL
jgi:hypothetical protein